MAVNFSLEKKILESIDKDSSIFLKLEKGGEIHIEKPVPYLLVYRYPKNEDDFFSYKLSHTEASYITGHHEDEDFCLAIQILSTKLAEKFGSFMFLEVWIGDHKNKQDDFKIKISSDAAMPIAEKLEQELNLIKLRNTHMRAFTDKVPIVNPPAFPRLLEKMKIEHSEIMLIGLEIFPNYINDKTGEPFPIYLRSLRKLFGTALKKTFFEFIRVHTSLQISHFQILGKTVIDDLVWELDDELAKVSNNFDFLFLTNPINFEEAWKIFKQNHFRKTPLFRYRYLPMDPENVKRNLYNLPIEKVEDPTIAALLREKRIELDKMLNMLMDRETPDFVHSSMQLFGGVDEDLLDIAEALLVATPKKKPSDEEDEENEESNKTRYVNAKDFAARAKKEMIYLKNQCPIVETKIEIIEDVDSLMVSNGKLFIGKNYRIAEDRMEALIQHEVGTHVATYYNGKSQPFKLLYSGVPGYEELQEGLAVLSEYLVGGLTNGRLRILAARVVAVHCMIDGHSFIETFNLLTEKYLFKTKTAFNITMRVYRGGGLTKDAVYLKGLVDLLEHLRKGNEIEPLLIGKIRQDYLPIMEEFIHRKILKPIPIKPRYLSSKYQNKINELKKGISVFTMIKK